MELIKFSQVQVEEASALLKLLADRYKLNVDVTDELVYCNDYYHDSNKPEENSIVLKTINEEEVTDVDLPGYYTSFL